MSEERVIDYSRYRVAEAIAEQWRAGDTAFSIGQSYFGGITTKADLTEWIVELIVAASDPRGKFSHDPPGTKGDR